MRDSPIFKEGAVLDITVLLLTVFLVQFTQLSAAKHLQMHLITPCQTTVTKQTMELLTIHQQKIILDNLTAVTK